MKDMTYLCCSCESPIGCWDYAPGYECKHPDAPRRKTVQTSTTDAFDDIVQSLRKEGIID